MAGAEVDLVDEILGPKPGGSAAHSIGWEPTTAATPDVVTAPGRRTRVPGPRSRTAHHSRVKWAIGLLVTFAFCTIVTLAVAAAVALYAQGQYSNRVVPGVRIGSVDVSGLTRDQVVSRLQTDFAYVGQGEVTVTTPTGAATITYQDAGRVSDVDFMADEAMRIGHSGNPIDDAVFMFRTAKDGRTVPISVRVDPLAVATHVRQVLDTTRVLPLDANVAPQNGNYSLMPATIGRGIDESAVSGAIVETLAQPDAPASFKAGGAFIEVNPLITDADAQAAIAEADRMAVDVNLTWSADTKAPGASQPPRVQTFAISAQSIRDWISFGTRPDGSYGPSFDSGPLQNYLSQIAPGLATKPVEPSVVFDGSGKPSGVKNGKDGASVDVAGTAKAVESYLAGLAAGGQPDPTLPIVIAPISPQLTPVTLSNMVIIGAWTTVFFPGITNGNGANIRVPAAIFNGQIVEPGKQFSFLRYVGPVDRAHGFTLGGVIKGGKSDHTGAMGGGICSASTTMFNAAARAGLRIDERHAHYYYIDRYPIGLDATVYASGGQVWDLKWTNDTPNPIVIRGSSTRGAKSTITIQLWSLPTGRTISFTPAFKANVVRASDRTVYVGNLKPGQQNRAEYPTPGFATQRTRTVTDSTGKVIHSDTWVSLYKKVDGLLQIGRARAPAPTPPPGAPGLAGASPAPATLAPNPNPTAGPRRRPAR